MSPPRKSPPPVAAGGAGSRTQKSQPNFTSVQSARKLPKIVLDDLARSGLDVSDAERLCITYHGPGDPVWERLAAIFKGLIAPVYAIPYFDLQGRPTDFVRYRVLGDYRVPGEKKSRKYLQLPGTAPRFYIPHHPKLDWPAIAQDTSISIYFVEGEKKAFSLAKRGYAAIGLGGVDCFTSGGIALPDFGWFQ